MNKPLPSLNALRAFEAAGRHRSITLASQELHVTPGAVSRQVKQLEAVLGLQLFIRASREVRLTPDGEAYLLALSDVFRRLAAATTRLLEHQLGRPLRVLCSMSVAMRWLFPRLLLFHAKHPEVHLSVNTSLTPSTTPFDADAADVIIRLGRATWPPDIVSHRLFPSEVVAVCSPFLLTRGPPLSKPQDLIHHTMLYSAQRPQLWPLWLAKAGVASLRFDGAQEFGTTALAYEAAVEGLGIALGECNLIEDDVRKGRLVQPFDVVQRNPESFFLLYRRQTEDDPRIRAFRSWILERVRRSQ